MKHQEFYKNLLENLSNVQRELTNVFSNKKEIKQEERDLFMHLAYAHHALLSLYYSSYYKDVLQTKNHKRRK